MKKKLFQTALLILLTAAALISQERPETLAGLLARPGTALLLRHAFAPGTGDPPGFRLGDCATQRNLSEEGRRQARELGRRLRAEGVAEARVYSSRWCRSRETAELLGLGPAVPLPALDSFFSQAESGPKQTRDLREFVRTLPPGPPVILVTHQVNITALTGIVPPSGGGVLVRIGVSPDGAENLGVWP